MNFMNKLLDKKNIAWIEIILGALIALIPFFVANTTLLWTEVILGILVLIFGFILAQSD